MTRVVRGPIYLDGFWYEALAFDSNGVVATNDEALKLGVEPTEVSFFTRAFHDAHAHPVLAGRDLLGLNVTNCTSVNEVQTRVAAYLTENPGTNLVVGGSYDRSIAKDGLFEASWLDEVSADRPVALHANDQHTLWVNTAALALITASERDTIGVDPRGILRESDAKNLVLRHEEKADDRAALLRAQTELLSLGVTSVFDAYVTDEILAAYLGLRESGKLNLGVEFAFSLEPTEYAERLDAISQHLDEPGASAVKLFVDGVFGNATAAVETPFATGGTGELYWSRHTLVAAIKAAGEHGLAAHLHAIGDRAIRTAIDALIDSGFANGAQIAHAELADAKLFGQMAENGITAVLQPLWARRDGMLASCTQHLQQRVEELYQYQTAVLSGVNLRFGSDWPVSSSDPLKGIFTAVYRSLPGKPETVLNAAQAMTLSDAFAAYQKPSGSDFVALSANPFDGELPAIYVTETIIGGQTVFARQ